MSEFNRRSYAAGKTGGSSPISSTPGQPANAKDREAFWQGKAQAQWMKPPTSTASPSFTASSSGGFSGGSGGGGSGSAAGKGAAGFVVILILIAIFASHDSNYKKTDASTDTQSIQNQDRTQDQTQGQPQDQTTTSTTTDGSGSTKPPAGNTLTFDQSALNGNEQTTPPPLAPDITSGKADAATADAPVRSAEPAATEAVEVPTGVFAAKHEEGLGGPWGQLTLAVDGIQFDTPSDHYNFPLDSIAGPHKNGFILKSGKRYHFKFDPRSNEDVPSLFSEWYQQARMRENQARMQTQP